MCSLLKLGKYYDKEHNPNGTIFWLGIAENSLMSKELIKVRYTSSQHVGLSLTVSYQYMESHFHLTPSHLKYRE